MIPEQEIDWREERGRMRSVANNVILHLHPTKVPVSALRFTYTWGLGGISTMLALLLISTGVLLMFRYEPTVERAYASIQSLESELFFGSLIRAIHHWSANLLVITVFLHFLRVFFTGGFKGKRGLNWIVGLSLLLVVLLFNFTGYLLPWDQLAYWAMTVATNLIGYLPLIGGAVSRFLVAGPEVGQAALSNFYAIHVSVLPILLIVFAFYHYWRIRKDGGISRPFLAPGQTLQQRTTLPYLVQKELAAGLVVLVSVTLFAMFVPAPLGDLADPYTSPNPAKAAWYFLGLQELLLHMNALAAMGLVGLLAMGLLLLPQLDRRLEDTAVYFRSPIGLRATITGAILGLYVVPTLVVWDEYWLDLGTALAAWPLWLATGLVPLLASVLGLCLIYLGLRRVWRASHSEALAGLVAFTMMSLVMLTLIGIYFRGPNMVLTWPF